MHRFSAGRTCNTRYSSIARWCTIALAGVMLASAAEAQPDCQGNPLQKTVQTGQTTSVTYTAAGGPHDWLAQVLSGAQFASVQPLEIQDQVQATFTFTGIAPGQTVFQVRALQPPFFKDCFVLLNVTSQPPPPPPPGTATDTYFAQSYRTFFGDPVASATGELFAGEPLDLYLGGPLPLYFGRYYAALLERDGSAAALLGAAPAGLLEGVTEAAAVGTNWLHNFAWRLTQDATSARIVTSLGRLIRFNKSGAAFVQTGVVDLPFQLVASGTELVLADPRSGLRRIFDSSGRLVRVEDGKGTAHLLTYIGDRLTEVSDTQGRALRFFYGAAGRLTRVTDGTRNVTFGYSGRTLSTVTDAEGNTIRYFYDQAGGIGALLAEARLPEGNAPFSQTWNAAGRVAEQEDALGNRHEFNYAASATTRTDPRGRTERHSYGANDLPTTHTDKLGRTTTFAHDAAGRRTSLTDRAGNTTGYTYHAASGQLASIRNPDGATIIFNYSSRTSGPLTFYDLTRITYPDGTSESFTYDAVGNLLSFTDQAGASAAFTYDGRGRVLTATNALGGVTTFVYNPDSTLDSLQDPAGNVTSFDYDTLKRLVQITHPGGARRRFTWDDLDRLTALRDERDEVTAFSYDGNSRLVRITDPAGRTRAFAYDRLDRLIRATDPLGKSSLLAYDALGNLAAVTGRNGETTAFAYDALSRLTQVEDPEGHRWRRATNREALPTSVTDPLNHTWAFASDRMGRLTRVRSPLGNRSLFRYDVMGRLREMVDPLGHIRRRTFDARGLISSVSIPGAGIAGSYQRNAAGEITAAIDANGNGWQWSYDGQGRAVSRTDPLGNVTAYEYDDRNRLARVNFPGGLGSVEFTYDEAGLLLRRRFADGAAFNYSYDALGRLVSANGLAIAYDANSRITGSNGLGAAYDAGGLMKSATLGPGKAVTFTHDAAGRLTRVRDWRGGNTDFVYDAASRLVRLERPNGVDTVYRYDADDRLTEIQEGNLASIELDRDANGQITAAARDLPLDPAPPAENVVFTYNAASQITNPGYAYDALGRMVSDGSRAYTWDQGSRLRRVVAGPNTVRYSYDALDRRLSRTLSGVARSYTWHYAYGAPRIAVERQAGAVVRTYVHTPGGALLYRVEGNGARHFYHYDQAGNVVFLTNDQGQVVESYAYDPFGRRLAGPNALQASLLGEPQGVPGLDPIEPNDTFTWGGLHGGLNDGVVFPNLLAGDGAYLPGQQGFLNFNLLPGTAPVSPYVLPDNDPVNREQEYLGASLTFNKRLASRWLLRGHTTATDGSWSNNFQLYQTERPQQQYTADASNFFNTGNLTHELRFGAGYREAQVQSLSRWPGLNYNGAFPSAQPKSAYGDAYLQDTLTIGNLTANSGLRYDAAGESESIWNKPIPGPFLPGQSLAPLGGESDFAWESISPRIGLTYALGAERRSLLRSSYSRFADQLGSGVVQHMNLGSYRYGYFYWNAGTPTSSSPDLPSALDGPLTDEMVLGVEHALQPEFVTGLHLTYRQYADILAREQEIIQPRIFRIGARLQFR